MRRAISLRPWRPEQDDGGDVALGGVRQCAGCQQDYGHKGGLAVGLLDRVFKGADGPFKVLFVLTPAR
jgi:hypothetical protein